MWPGPLLIVLYLALTAKTLDTPAITQWFLKWVRSSPRDSVSQFLEFGCLVHPTCIIRDITLCLVNAPIQYIVIYKSFEFEEKRRILFLQLRRARCMHVWNVWVSVLSTKLRAHAIRILSLPSRLLHVIIGSFPNNRAYL